MTTTINDDTGVRVAIDPANPGHMFLYRVESRDGVGRERPCDVGIRDERVVLLAPAGAAATMDARQSLVLAAALIELAAETHARSGEHPELAAAFTQFRREGGWGARLRELLPPVVAAPLSGGAGGTALLGVLPGEPAPPPVAR